MRWIKLVLYYVFLYLITWALLSSNAALEPLGFWNLTMHELIIVVAWCVGILLIFNEFWEREDS